MIGDTAPYDLGPQSERVFAQGRQDTVRRVGSHAQNGFTFVGDV